MANTVFISYSRHDRLFAAHLQQLLEEQQRDVWIDLEDIRPTAEWLKAVFAGIEAANSVVFVLSPDSAASEVCRNELAHASDHHKRLIPVVYREVAPSSVPAELSARQWILFRDGDDPQAAFQAVLAALDTDLEWVD